MFWRTGKLDYPPWHSGERRLCLISEVLIVHTAQSDNWHKINSWLVTHAKMGIFFWKRQPRSQRPRCHMKNTKQPCIVGRWLDYSLCKEGLISVENAPWKIQKNSWIVARWQDAGEGPALWLYWSWPLGSCCLPPPAWQRGGGDTQHVAKQPPSPSYIDDFLNWNVNLFVTILIKGGQIVSGPRWRWVRRQFSLLQRPPFILWHFPLQLEDNRYFWWFSDILVNFHISYNFLISHI